MRKLSMILVCFLSVLAIMACGAESGAQSADEAAPASGTTPETDEQQTLYGIGVMMAQNLGQLALSDAELDQVIAGLRDAASGAEVKVDLQSIAPKVQAFAQSRAMKAAETEKAAAQAFADEMAGQAGAERTESGMVYIELAAGDGASPGATDKVKVHYHGTLRDGSVFDSSVDRGQPIDFGLNQVIPCWTEGLQKMKVGGKAKLVCPSDIAYGDGGRPPKIPGGATLVFEVELLGINEG